MWYVRDVLYAVLYVRVSCFVVRGCGVSRRYIDVCYCDMFSVVNVYLDHLKFYVVCINSRRYVCCSECDVVSNECNNIIIHHHHHHSCRSHATKTSFISSTTLRCLSIHFHELVSISLFFRFLLIVSL